MGQADVGVTHAAPARTLGEGAGEPESGSAPSVRHNLHLSETALENPGAERLETRFLGGEARGQRLHAIRATRARRELRRGEHPLREAARTVQGATQPIRIDDVQTDPEDHVALLPVLSSVPYCRLGAQVNP